MPHLVIVRGGRVAWSLVIGLLLFLAILVLPAAALILTEMLSPIASLNFLIAIERII